MKKICSLIVTMSLSQNALAQPRYVTPTTKDKVRACRQILNIIPRDAYDHKVTLRECVSFEFEMQIAEDAQYITITGPEVDDMGLVCETAFPLEGEELTYDRSSCDFI